MLKNDEMTSLEISNDLAALITSEAALRGISIEEFLQRILLREQTLAQRRKIEDEQEWWLGLPLSARAQYEGEFIAVHRHQVVDHDRDEAALAARVRARYAGIPVLIMPAEGPREIRIFSPRMFPTE